MPSFSVPPPPPTSYAACFPEKKFRLRRQSPASYAGMPPSRKTPRAGARARAEGPPAARADSRVVKVARAPVRTAVRGPSTRAAPRRVGHPRRAPGTPAPNVNVKRVRAPPRAARLARPSDAAAASSPAERPAAVAARGRPPPPDPPWRPELRSAPQRLGQRRDVVGARGGLLRRRRSSGRAGDEDVGSLPAARRPGAGERASSAPRRPRRRRRAAPASARVQRIRSRATRAGRAVPRAGISSATGRVPSDARSASPVGRPVVPHAAAARRLPPRPRSARARAGRRPRAGAGPRRRAGAPNSACLRMSSYPQRTSPASRASRSVSVSVASAATRPSAMSARTCGAGDRHAPRRAPKARPSAPLRTAGFTASREAHTPGARPPRSADARGGDDVGHDVGKRAGSTVGRRGQRADESDEEGGGNFRRRTTHVLRSVASAERPGTPTPWSETARRRWPKADASGKRRAHGRHFSLRWYQDVVVGTMWQLL